MFQYISISIIATDRKSLRKNERMMIIRTIMMITIMIRMSTIIILLRKTNKNINDNKCDNNNPTNNNYAHEIGISTIKAKLKHVERVSFT